MAKNRRGAVRTREEAPKCVCCGINPTSGQYGWYARKSAKAAWRARCAQCNSSMALHLYKELREKAIAKLGGKCARCGNPDPRCLQIDHVNAGGHAEIKALGGGIALFRRVLADADDVYQALCANCNWIKRVENEEVPTAEIAIPS